MSHMSDTALETRIESLKAQYEAQFGVVNPYPVNRIRGGGQIYVDVDGSFGASGWLWEISTWENLKPTLSDWLAIYYPKAFPIFLAFAKAVEKAPQFIFQDGFENGLPPWTGTTIQGGQVTASTAYKRTGSYSLKCVTTSTANTEYDAVHYTLAQSYNKICVKAWVYIPDSVLGSMTGYSRVYPIALTNSAGDYCLFGIRKPENAATGGIRYYLAVTNMNSAGRKVNTGYYYTVVSVSKVPQWTLFELLWDKTANMVQVWATGDNGQMLNGGNPIISKSLNFSTITWNKVEIGAYKYSTNPRPTGPWPVTMYCDDVTIDDALISTATSGV
jgi:hypothetical protein